jgi:hypothetical protein
LVLRVLRVFFPLASVAAPAAASRGFSAFGGSITAPQTWQYSTQLRLYKTGWVQSMVIPPLAQKTCNLSGH